MVNVLYYLRKFPKISESFILNEIHALKQRDHNVAVFALADPNEQFTHQEFEDLDIPVKYGAVPGFTDVLKLFSSKTVLPSVIKGTSADISATINAANVFWTKQCIEFVKSLDWNIDLIHTHFANKYKLSCIPVADYYDIPFTITTHAYDLYRNPIGDYTGRLLRTADRIVTISEYNKKHIREQFVSNTPIDIIRAGIRPDKFSPRGATKENRILTVARLHRKKGLKHALEAVSTVVQRIPDIEYHIVGSGPLYDDLVRQVMDLDIEQNVVFLEQVSDERLITEYDEARCFLLPAVVTESGERDGIPVSLMEAMAVQTPPVSTTVSGIPELVDHEKNGLLTEPRNAEATAEALLRLLRNDSEWSEYRHQAREKVLKEFNISKEADKLVKTFKAAKEPDNFYPDHPALSDQDFRTFPQ